LLVEEGERAALNFQRKDFEIVQQDQVRDPSPTNRAVSIRCRMFSVMSELGPNSDVDTHNWDVGFTPMSGHRQPGRSGPKSADIVAKVENRTTLKISRKSIFGLLCCCVAF
jgi:hypothetical protein